ncbi:tetratricopeptide repeat protein [Thermogutta sp.]|uniref:tetratricopeptide repeat protein n=2 Tax=Thermogutta sp. TaxID=1962930 RepID=UPI00322035AA
MHRELMATRLLEQSRLLSQQAHYALQRGDLQEADRLLVQALRTCPTDVEARANYARVLWQCNKREEALQQLQMALDSAPQNPDLHVQMAEFLVELGRLDQAERHARSAIAVAPKSPAAWLIQGRIALMKNRPDEALGAFYRVLGLRPDDRDALHWIAEAYRVKGDWEQVLAVRQRILQGYSPGDEPPEQLAALGEAYRMLGRYADAAATYLQAAQRSRDSAPYLALAAECYAQAGNTDAAQRLTAQIQPQQAPRTAAPLPRFQGEMTRMAGQEMFRR